MSIKMTWKLPNCRTLNTTNNKIQKPNRYIFGAQNTGHFLNESRMFWADLRFYSYAKNGP